MKNLFYLLLLSFSIIGCKSKEPIDEKVAFYSFSGKYIAADKSIDSVLIADRFEKREWETFILRNIQGNSYTISTLDSNYVCVDTSNNNCLVANKKNSTTDCVFEILFNESIDIVTIKAFNSRYVSLSENSIITANSIQKPIASSLYIDKKKDTFLGLDFDIYQLVFLFNTLILIFLSILIFNFRNDKKLSLILLILGGISLRIFAALLTPYLNIWDERFHALVAKNMIENPLKPMLYTNPILPYDIGIWDSNHIWLHKQPLFLWQIALFFKFFGVNEFVLRLPSLLMSSLLIIIIYRIAKLLSNENIAYYAALLYTCSYFTLELVSGKIATDHNDIAFAFYITMSIWAWTELYFSKQKKWIFWIGLFAGMAILNKWLAGLLVYSGWGLAVLFNANDRKCIRSYLEILYAFIVTIIVALPWQIYILYKFPIESKHEFEYNAKHLFEVIEKHGGNFLFHFDETINIYGLHYMVIILSVFMLFKILKNNYLKIAFYTYIILIYLLYSIAATKMYSFTYCISSLIYIALGGVLFLLLNNKVINKINQFNPVYSKSFNIIILSVICYFNIDIERIQKNHNKNQKFKTDFIVQNLIHTPVYKQLSKIVPDNSYVIFNAYENEDVSIMFYTDFIAYDFPISKEIYNELKMRNIKMATFDNGDLPDFVKNDNEIFIIR